MDELKAKVQRLCSIKNVIMTAVEGEVAKGLECVNTNELGEAVDMIKDLCEAEEKCYKAHYYKTVVEAMHDEKKEEEILAKLGMNDNDRMGYDHWRYDSGRFAPTGRGHRSGYHDPEQIEDWMNQDAFGDGSWPRMGYPQGGRNGRGSQSSNSSNSNNNSMGSNGRMGYTGSERGHRYDRWHQARMGYHESKDAAHKEHMDDTAREYVGDIAESIREIWRDADPAMRKEIKSKFVALTGEMN